jgi:hypothetical protein
MVAAPPSCDSIADSGGQVVLRDMMPDARGGHRSHLSM